MARFLPRTFGTEHRARGFGVFAVVGVVVVVATVVCGGCGAVVVVVGGVVVAGVVVVVVVEVVVVVTVVVAGGGGPVGVTAFDGDGGPYPTAFRARTVNV